MCKKSGQKALVEYKIMQGTLMAFSHSGINIKDGADI